MSHPCPKCGGPIPEHSPHALCPACLLAGKPESLTTPDGDQLGETVPESVEPSSDDSLVMLHGQFAPGTVLASRYRIVSLLGKGGMGEVYRADDLMLKEPVALKILPRQFGTSHRVLESLRNEVKQARQVSHRHVCRVHDLSESEERQMVSMEFIQGEDLASLLRRIGHLPLDKALQLARQLAEGMAAAHHQDVLHLDLKPANLMIDRRGDLKISDFGLARLSSRQGEQQRIAGTPAYMAPEQALGDQLSPRTDIYAFGLVLHEMLTGQRALPARTFDEVRAFHAKCEAIPPPSTHRQGLPSEIGTLVVQCLQADPADRPPSFETIVEALRAMAGPGVEIIPARAGEPADSTIDESDIYLSYAPVDDRPLSSEKSGWITQFHRNLEVRVEQLSGRQVRVFRLPPNAAGQEPNSEVLKYLPEMKAMISVLSPPFVNSSGCVREVNAFWESHVRDGRLYVDGHTRVLKVVKTPVENDDLPPELRDKLQELLGFEFFDYDPETGRLREYAEWYGAEAQQRFHERVYDLAQEINAILKATGHESAAPGKGKTVYLATATSDIAPLRDRIRRELVGRGHRVVPEKPVPLVASEAESAIKSALAECDLSIHPIGSTYGVVPEGCEQSLAALQNALASESSRETGLARIIWIPDGVAPSDARQEVFLHSLKTDPECHRNAEIVINSFQTLKPIVFDKLTADVSEPAAPGDSSGRPRRIYLICDPQDQEAIEPLEDFLFAQGFDLALPDFEADEAEAAQVHRDNLRDCDGVIIFYGAARNSWVDVKLRNILKMSGYGREGDLAFNAVYIAPPFDRRKERYRSHSAEIIRQESDFNPALLQPIVSRLQQA